VRISWRGTPYAGFPSSAMEADPRDERVPLHSQSCCHPLQQLPRTKFTKLLTSSMRRPSFANHCPVQRPRTDDQTISVGAVQQLLRQFNQTRGDPELT